MEPNRTDANEPLPPPSDDLEAIARDRKKRRTRMLAGAAVFVAGVAGGLTALSMQQERKADERIAHAFGALGRCLLGPPLEASESPGNRLRRVQLTAMTLADEQRTIEGAQWPQRCGTFAYQLDESIRDAGRGKGDKDLAHAAAALGKLLGDTSALSADLTAAVEALWSLAPLENVQAGPAVEVPVAPGRAEPLDADALARGTPLAQKAFSFRAVYTEPHPALDLHVLIDDPGAPGSPFLCTVTQAGPAARCVALPPAIAGTKQGLRLLGTADDGAAPLVFAGNRGSEGIFRADSGDLVTRFYAYGGHAAADGFSAVLGWREKEKELVAARKLAAAATTEAKLDPPFRTGNPYYSAQMLWDVVMLRGVTKDNRRRLFALALGRSGSVLGDPVDVGELAEPGLIEGGLDEPPHITGCRTKDAMVVRVKGYDHDFMSFRLGGKWSEPISPELTGGTLSCSRSTATVTRVEPAANDSSHRTSVRQAHCTSAGCRTQVMRMEQLLHRHIEFAPHEGHVDAVDLDGNLLVVWAAGERGGVRMRMGPIETIANAPDVILYDDMMKDGRVGTLSTLFDLKLFSREGYALLLLSTQTGVHGLRIDSSGKVTPLSVAKG
jgi:hypothetical protein